LTIEDAVCQVIKSLRHTDLTDKRTLKILERATDEHKKDVEALKLL